MLKHRMVALTHAAPDDGKIPFDQKILQDMEGYYRGVLKDRVKVLEQVERLIKEDLENLYKTKRMQYERGY